jgi:hypothetical protein
VSIEIIEKKSLVLDEKTFEIVVFRDATDPNVKSFKVLHDGREFPLKVLGGQLHFIRFSVADEVEQDAAALKTYSPMQELFTEAERMLRATLNG